MKGWWNKAVQIKSEEKEGGREETKFPTQISLQQASIAVWMQKDLIEKAVCFVWHNEAIKLFKEAPLLPSFFPYQRRKQKEEEILQGISWDCAVSSYSREMKSNDSSGEQER